MTKTKTEKSADKKPWTTPSIHDFSVRDITQAGGIDTVDAIVASQDAS